MDLSKMTRRDFHKSTTLGVTSLALSPGPAVRNVVGANDRIGVGLIGAGGQGRFDFSSMIRTNQVDPIAAADVYSLPLAQTLDSIGVPPGKTVGYGDFRKILDRKDIDAVIVATPEHWHGIPMIMACQAGKDVYVEKPISHTIYEGRKMVEAANKYNRVVTCGTQQRSGEHYQKVVEMIRGGKIGKVTYVEAYLYGGGFTRENRKQMPPPDCDPPPGFDWDFWLGPAPYHHYNRSRRGFTGFWETGGGETTNWGPHLMDVVHWAMQVDAPVTVSGSGGRFGSQGVYDTPDTFESLYEYPALPAELRRLSGALQLPPGTRTGRAHVRNAVLRNRRYAVHQPRRLCHLAGGAPDRRVGNLWPHRHRKRRWHSPAPAPRGQFPGVRALAPEAERRYRDDPPHHQFVHHCQRSLSAGTEVALGSRQGAVHRRRGSQQNAERRAPETVGCDLEAVDSWKKVDS